MKAPSICQIRSCCGELVAKGSNRLQCQQAQHHSAWLVESDGSYKWEFSTRGINFLKGKLVTEVPAASTASPEDERALVQLLDNPQKIEKKEAVADPTLADLHGDPEPEQPVPVKDVQKDGGKKKGKHEQQVPEISETSKPTTSSAQPDETAGAPAKKQPRSDAKEIETAATDETVKTPAKKRPRPEAEQAETPPDMPSKESKLFGGKQARSEGCLCCGCPRQRDQRGRLCPPCLLNCKKVLGHQRIEDLMSDSDAVLKVKAMTEAKQVQAEAADKADQKEMLSRLEKIFKQIPRLERLIERILATDVD